MMTHLEDTLEQQALNDGNKRYFKSLESSTSRNAILDRSDLKKVLKEALPLVSEELKRKLGEEQKGRHSLAHQVLKNLDPDLISLVGLSSCFQIISKHKPLVSICYSIGMGIDNELWAARLYQKDPKMAKRLVERAKKSHGSVSYRRKAVKAVASKEGITSAILADDERVKVGGWVLDVVLKAVPEVFTHYTVKSKSSEVNYVSLTEEASQAIADVREVQSWMHPAYKPMVTPPKPWTEFYNGCYHNPKVARTVQLVRTSNQKQVELVQKAIKDGTMKYCLESLNAIQETRWAINRPIYELVKWAYEEGLSLPSFPPRNHLSKPKPIENWDEASEREKKGWKIQAAQVAVRNRGIDSERIVMLQDLCTAEKLLEVPQFYIPHSLDFRGRVYPIPAFNQQRGDHIKAQLRFAEGRVLTASGAYWLAVHLANCGDFDKISKAPFDARVAWVAENEQMIFDIAENPYATFDLWKDADSPFSYVAACLEWAGYRKDPESFKSHLAVALDGSNSGLQHYSCMMRSEREGALVNLLPTEKPADLYQTVADHVKEMVEADAEKGLEVAKVVLKNGVTRKLCKRATMTFAYSSEEFGFKEQLMSDFMRPAAVEVLQGKLDAHPWEMMRTDKEGETRPDGGFTAAAYIAKCIWKAVNDIVMDACKGMAFFRRCAQILAHEGKGLIWVTPVGLPVLHLYPEYNVKKVKLFLHDKEVRLFPRTGATEVVNKTKAADAVSPNVVHSMDSAALMLCVLDCKDAGIKDFAMIHDSFGAHPNDTETMYVAVRQSLINMYEGYCPFEEIRRQTIEAIDAKEKVPSVPEKGALDLANILNADYAFA